MSKVHAFIMSGLGHVASNGIIYNLAARLVALDDVEVRVGSYQDYSRFAAEARSLPSGTYIIGIGHSLGGSVLPEWARLIGKPVAAIFGFDPAENIAANPTQYGLTPVPGNVEVAKAIYVPGGGLGGGQYTGTSATFIENTPIDAGHTAAEEGIEQHLEIEEFTKRLLVA